MIAAHDMLFDSTADSEGCPVLVVVLQESMNDTSRRWRGEGLRVVSAAPREDDWTAFFNLIADDREAGPARGVVKDEDGEADEGGAAVNDEPQDYTIFDCYRRR